MKMSVPANNSPDPITDINTDELEGEMNPHSGKRGKKEFFLNALAWLSVPILLLLIILYLYALNYSDSYQYPRLTFLLGLVFTTFGSVLIAFLAGRSFLYQAMPSMLMLGCGALILGSGGVVANLNPNSINNQVAVHNLCFWLSACFHLAGVVINLKQTRAMRGAAGVWLGLAYLVSFFLVWVIRVSVIEDLVPPFFIQGQGGTPLRQIVLIASIGLFILSAALLKQPKPESTRFKNWYALALLLIAIGLLGVLLQHSMASLIGWTGRAAQYIGGLCMLIAAAVSVRESRSWKLTIETALRETKQQYESLVDLAADGILVHDLPSETERGCFIEANSAFCELLGYTLEEMQSLTLRDIIGAKDHQAFLNKMQQTIAQDCLLKHEETLIAKDGRSVPTEISTRIFLKQGRPKVISIVRDFTERKKAEETLRESELLLRSTLDGLSFNIALLDEKGTILLVNKAWRKFAEQNGILSVSAVSEGSNYLQICDGASGESSEEAGPFAEGIRAVISGVKESYVLEYPCHSPDKKRWFVGRISPFPGDGPRRVVVVHEDITERNRAEKELRESKALIDAVVDNVPLMIFLKEATDLRFVILNRAGEELLGYDRKRLLGKNNLDLFPAEQAAFFMAKDRQVLDGETGFLDIPEEPIMTAKKGERLLHTRKVCIRGGDGTTKYLLGISEDITESKRAGMALRESEEKFRQIVETATEGIWATDAEHRLIFANHQMAEILGYSIDEMIGQSADSFVFEEDVNDLAEQLRKRRSGEKAVYERRLRRKDGNGIWAIVSASPIMTSNGQFAGSFGMFTDIAERKRMEDALHESEEIFNLFMENSPVYVFFKDETTRPIRLSRNYEQMMGRPIKDLLGKTMDELFPSELAKGMIEDDLNVLRDGEPIRIVEKFNGRIFETTKFPIIKPGKSSLLAGFTIDITERKLAENAIRESEAQYRTLIENIPQAVILKDRESKYISINVAYAIAFGLRQEEVIGKSDYDFHPNHLADKFRQEDRLVMETGECREFEEENAKDGKMRFYHKVKVPVRDKTGKIIGVLSTLTDITERKRSEDEHKKLEAQLRQAQKMEAVGRLSGGVAHDFNNMLSVILGFTELAIMKLPVDDPVRLYLDEVKIAAQRSADITRQLLAFARKQIIAPKVLDLNDTIASTLNIFRRLIGEDIDLLWKPAKDLWRVKVDPSQIDQVLANLMVNARDAIAGVGKITIETGNVEFDEHYREAHVGSVPGRYVLLVVSDDGCGMDKETLSKLFEPFFTTKEAGKGTGLGLATIYGIVKQNNGFIDVYSEPGQGATFKIYLPRQELQEAATEQPRKPAEASTGTETVLLVEDEKSLLKFARMLLEELGYTVLAADSPRAAIQLAKEYTHEIHLLMTDVVMPKMSGRDLWEQLNLLRPGIKCLFMSGYTANVIAHHGVLDEGIHFLQKPFSREALATKIREVLS
jgi:two-component system cell cycle sensor histidine kinase/response regulator CckA